jgi:hypothetical protein
VLCSRGLSDVRYTPVYAEQRDALDVAKKV